MIPTKSVKGIGFPVTVQKLRVVMGGLLLERLLLALMASKTVTPRASGESVSLALEMMDVRVAAMISCPFEPKLR